MRRIVAVLLVALLAFTLVGCGGGAEEPPPADTAAPAAPPPPPAPEDQALIPDRSNVEEDVFEIFPTGEFVPDSLAKKIADKQPTVILFVDGAQKDTNDVKKEVNAVIKANQGLADLFIYDLGKYASISKDGQIKVDEAALKEDPTAADAVNLARELGVSFTPFIVVTDDQGYLIFKHRGFIDAELLEPQLQRVSD